MTTRHRTPSLLETVTRRFGSGLGRSLLAISGCALLVAGLAFRVPGAQVLTAAALVAVTVLFVRHNLRRRGRPFPSQASHSLLEAVINAVPHALYVKDLQQRLVLVNQVTAEMAGMAPQDLVGKYISELASTVIVPPDQLRRIAETDAEILKTGRPVEFEMERVYPDGRRQMRVIKIPLRNEAGEIAWIVMMVEDVSARARVEREVQEQRAMLRTVVDAIPHYLYVKDRNDRFITVNRAMEKRLPKGAPSLVGQHVMLTDQRDPDEIRRTTQDNLRVLKEGISLDLRRDVEVAPYGLRHLRTIKRPLKNAEGEIIGLVGLDEDETDRVRAERQVAQQRELLQSVLDAIPQDLFVKDQSGKVILVNQAISKRWNKPKEELIGLRGFGVGGISAADLARIEESDRRVLEAGEAHTWEQQLTDASGAVFTFRVHKVPLRDHTGAITGLVMTGEDISALVASQQELAESRHLLRTVLDAIPETVSLKGTDLRYRLINRRMPMRIGLLEEQAIGGTQADLPFLTAEGKEDIARADQEVLRTCRPVEVPMVRWVGPGDKVRYERVLKEPVLDRAGNLIGIVTIGEDVTAQIMARQQADQAQRLLRAVLEGIPESVSFKDAELRYRVVNRHLAEGIGLKPEEMIGRTVDDLPWLSPGNKSDVRKSDEEVLSTGQPATIPLMEMLKLDGGVRWDRVLKHPVKAEDGSVTGIVTINEDVTELVTSRQAAERARRLLQTILDTLPAGVFVKDLQGRFTLASAPFADVYGLTPPQILGRTSDNLPYLSPERKLQFAGEDRRMIEEGTPVDSGVFLGPDVPGRPQRWFRVVKVPLKDDTGRMLGIVGLAEDVTLQRRAEEERLALSRLMQRTQNLESLGVMAAGIAHEFNNLLQRIIGHTELVLAEIPRGHSIRTDAEMIQKAGRTAVALTNQMVTLSGRSRFKVDLVQLNSVLEHLLTEIRSLLPDNVVLSHHIGGTKQMALADEPLLQQVIVSLVINAKEALGEAGGHIRLEVGSCRLEPEMVANHAYSDRTLPAGDYAYVEVRDNGPGIPQDILDRIYEPFFSTKFIGRGLGLAAVRGIVHGHHGALHVRSKVGEGTAFRVLLPMKEE